MSECSNRKFAYTYLFDREHLHRLSKTNKNRQTKNQIDKKYAKREREREN